MIMIIVPDGLHDVSRSIRRSRLRVPSPWWRRPSALPEPQAAFLKMIHEEVDRDGVRSPLASLERSLTGSPIDAEDLAYQALVKVIDPNGSPSNTEPARSPDWERSVGWGRGRLRRLAPLRN
jgi:hypothetical protein